MSCVTSYISSKLTNVVRMLRLSLTRAFVWPSLLSRPPSVLVGLIKIPLGMLSNMFYDPLLGTGRNGVSIPSRLPPRRSLAPSSVVSWWTSLVLPMPLMVLRCRSSPSVLVSQLVSRLIGSRTSMRARLLQSPPSVLMSTVRRSPRPTLIDSEVTIPLLITSGNMTSATSIPRLLTMQKHGLTMYGPSAACG